MPGLEPQQSLVRARALGKHYPGAHAAPAVLENLDFDIGAGEIVVVAGRSGSGKSTLLNLIGQMDTPSSGSLWVDGVSTAQWSDDERTAFRCRRLGFVFQAYNLLPSLTVRENIALPLELNALADEGRVQQLLDRLGIGDLGERFPDQLSGGEQQRTAIARAIVHRPQLIIADEPTGNLDHETGRQVVDLFERNVREAGAALLMATHSSEMIGHADRVVELIDGRLHELAR